MKLVSACWDVPVETLLDPALRAQLRRAGTTRLQVEVDDQPVTALRLTHFDAPVQAVVMLWAPSTAPLEVLRPLGRVASWEVEERVPLAPPEVADGLRRPALTQVAFLRRPRELAHDDWLAHWHGPHTEVALRTQATTGYVQNRVVRPLGDAPAVDAIVEEHFPPEAAGDLHAFYGSGGSEEELDRRMTELLTSVAVMGADRDLDVVPTTAVTWSLS